MGAVGRVHGWVVLLRYVLRKQSLKSQPKNHEVRPTRTSAGRTSLSEDVTRVGPKLSSPALAEIRPRGRRFDLIPTN